MNTYAKVEWCADDILTLRPEWTVEQAEDWLDENKKHIQNRLVELGWEVIRDLLSFDEK